MTRLSPWSPSPKDGVEPGQVGRVALDDRPGIGAARTGPIGIEVGVGVHGSGAFTSADDSAPRSTTAIALGIGATLHRNSCCGIAFFLMTSRRRCAPSRNPGATKGGAIGGPGPRLPQRDARRRTARDGRAGRRRRRARGHRRWDGGRTPGHERTAHRGGAPVGPRCRARATSSCCSTSAARPSAWSSRSRSSTEADRARIRISGGSARRGRDPRCRPGQRRRVHRRGRRAAAGGARRWPSCRDDAWPEDD